MASIGYKTYITVSLEYLGYIGCGRSGQSSDLKTTRCYYKGAENSRRASVQSYLRTKTDVDHEGSSD